jgi:hypothetical protein
MFIIMNIEIKFMMNKQESTIDVYTKIYLFDWSKFSSRPLITAMSNIVM